MSKFLFLIGLLVTATVSAQTPGAKISYVLKDSKMFFTTKVEDFKIEVTDGKQITALPCMSRYMYVAAGGDLMNGWDISQFNLEKYLAEAGDYRSSQSYIFTSCRTAKAEVMGWFRDRRENESSNADEVSDKDYDSKKRPLQLRVRSLPNGQESFYVCDGQRNKVQIADKENYVAYNVDVSCRPADRGEMKAIALIDFVQNPGPFAALISYRGGMLPSVPSTSESLQAVTKALFAQVPAGQYSGAMSTLKKTCDLETSANGDTLYINHTITTGKARTRRLELKAENLRGFIEGVVYNDPIRIEAEDIGSFAAAEFYDPKKEAPIHVRFEKLKNLDGLLVRINGSEAYCRRLN